MKCEHFNCHACPPEYVFRGGYIEDASGTRWWSAELLEKVEKERDEARAEVERLLATDPLPAKAMMQDLERQAFLRGAERQREACAERLMGPHGPAVRAARSIVLSTPLVTEGDK